MKAIIFDSGTLITLSMNDLLDMLCDLKNLFDGKFLITREIEDEIVNKPMQIKKYKLGALRLKKIIDSGVLEFPESLNVKRKDIQDGARIILKSANSIFYIGGSSLKIIQEGEASVLALSKLLSERGIKNIVAIDERTTRVLCEKPENLKEILEGKLHTKVDERRKQGNILPKIKFIRSTELIYIAYKKGLVNGNKEILDAMLYGAKFKGAAISSEEIKEMERMA